MEQILIQQPMTKRKLECIKIEKTNPYKLNFEGKKELAVDVIEELFEEEVINFLKGWGYNNEKI